MVESLQRSLEGVGEIGIIACPCQCAHNLHHLAEIRLAWSRVHCGVSVCLLSEGETDRQTDRQTGKEMEEVKEGERERGRERRRESTEKGTTG